MPALPNSNPNYLDWAKRRDPDGTTAGIMEIMNIETPIVEDATVMEANDTMSHRTTVRTGLPKGAWRRLNYGVPKEKSTTAQVTDRIGSLETYAEVDKDLAMLNGEDAMWRLSEETAFMEGLAQTMAQTVFYGNTDTDPERFLGLTPRYNDTTAKNSRMVINSNANGAAATNCSVWGVVWHPMNIHMTFPKGGKAGMKHEDLGQETLTDAEGNYYEGLRSHYQWKAGMVVRDWRQVVRIQFNANDLTSVSLIDGLIEGYNAIQKPGRGRLVWYANRNVKTAIDKEAKNQANMAFDVQQQDNGGPVTMFWKSPVKLEESLVNTEAIVASS